MAPGPVRLSSDLSHWCNNMTNVKWLTAGSELGQIPLAKLESPGACEDFSVYLHAFRGGLNRELSRARQPSQIPRA